MRCRITSARFSACFALIRSSSADSSPNASTVQASAVSTPPPVIGIPVDRTADTSRARLHISGVNAFDGQRDTDRPREAPPPTTGVCHSGSDPSHCLPCLQAAHSLHPSHPFARHASAIVSSSGWQSGACR